MIKLLLVTSLIISAYFSGWNKGFDIGAEYGWNTAIIQKVIKLEFKQPHPSCPLPNINRPTK